MTGSTPEALIGVVAASSMAGRIRPISSGKITTSEAVAKNQGMGLRVVLVWFGLMQPHLPCYGIDRVRVSSLYTMARTAHATSTGSTSKDRLAVLRKSISESSVDALIISDPKDVGYLTGFLGGDSWLIVSSDRKKPVLITDSRYAEEVEPLGSMLSIRMRTGQMSESVVAAVAEASLKTVGVQAEQITVAARDALSKALGAKRVVAVSGLVSKQRAVKDAGEISLIKKALKIQQEAMIATLPTIRPGQTELEVCARLEFEMKTRGSSEPSFTTIVAAQANGSKPHYHPSTTKTVAGKPLLIDWGATWHGYHGDMTRTFSLGRWPKAIREIYSVVLEAHERAVAALRAGVTNHEVDAAARRVIDQAGYGEKFGHGLGHGVGLNIHEGPSLGPRGVPVEMAVGHVVTIEPGIYLPGVGGVRLEDVYAVTERGCTRLTSLPRDLEWATIGS